MYVRLLSASFGILICTMSSAQSLEGRVIDLELRVGQLEAQASGLTAPKYGSKALSVESWRFLKREMTEKEVQFILGEPGRIGVTASYTRWEYPDDAYLLFDSDGRLKAWNEPK